MSRTAGSPNIILFENRDEIATTESQDIKHLANATSQTPLEQFIATLSHQRSYLRWLESRHAELTQAKEDLGEHTPKRATYRKYRWYSEQLLLLETINAFEVFYKTTIVRLGRTIKRYVPPSRVKGVVDAKVLWGMSGRVSASALLFEHQLFHDLETIDDATQMLVQARRYNPNNLRANADHLNLLRSLRAVFQVRHTLSHNQGVVTNSDAVKFKLVGFTAAGTAVIDPTKDALGESVRRFLSGEAELFTEWLIDKTADYLLAFSQDGGEPLPVRLKERITDSIGSTQKLQNLQWV
ncbi:hypothetical protein [Burkholderia lata]|uniref:hypothetical protein n=1 Tax=Burkholderia lata (strain ATCC 17760 / DSM 23089 / LMG 22485 / NCIMB 9086 / R18194 / 383) TaxID=482957 RepID=UPI0014541C9C|nr:hypothetical protein [Burkholderia lata]VWM09722.1 hypothetical protein BLA6992_03710 [Burkholderia lata]